MSAEIKDNVRHIVESLEDREKTVAEWVAEDPEHNKADEWSVGDYLGDVLDIQYIVDSSKEYLGCRLLVAFGGPNIWINTFTGQVEGSWWLDTCNESFTDELGIDEYMSDVYGSI